MMDRYYSSDEDREERREASSSRRSKEERSERRSEKRKSHRRDRSKERYARYERSRSRSHGRRSRSRSRSKRSRSPRRDYSRHHDSKSKCDKETDKGTTSASILNPVIFNSGRYAEQIAKRKALFQNSRKPDAAEQEVKNTAIWQSAKFSQDQDGKMTAKFQRLMGIKDNAPKPQQDGKVKDMFKKQEELFSTMEMQYEVARATTHTQRGVGLGFGPRHIP